MTAVAPRASHPPLAIAVRRARPADKVAVLAFATTTWDGWDYIPQAWDRWLAADDGVVLVACAADEARGAGGEPVAAGQPVAIARLAMVAPGEAWLEGIRVDPAVRGRGVATNLQVAELAWAAAHQARVVRYATGHENEGSHRLGAHHGFVRLADRRSYGPVEADDDPERPRDPSAVTIAPGDAPDDVVARWWRMVAGDATFAAGDGLYEARPWAYQALDEDRFGAHVRRGEVLLARDEGALLIAPHGEAEVADLAHHIALVAGDGSSALTLLDDLRRAAGAAPHVRLPDPPPPLLANGGVARWAAAGLVAHRGALHLLARTLDPAAGLPAAEPPEGLVLAEPPRPIARPPVL